MKNTIAILLNALLLMLCSCGVNSEGSQSFDYNLQGTWETTGYTSTYCSYYYLTADECPYATIEIGYKSIKINGNIKNFSIQGIPKGVSLEMYSEDGFIYVKDFGEWKTVPYILDKESGSYKKNLLAIQSSNTEREIFKLVEEDTCEYYYYDCY